MELDLIERCRAGDPASLTALQAIWGPRALAVAQAAAVDDAHASDAVTEAFERAWQQLPAQHSTVPFRPWFLGLVARITIGERKSDDADLAKLIAGGRGADEAARRILSKAPTWLPVWRASTPRPDIAPVHAVTASLPADVHSTFAAFRDPARIPVWIPGARVRGRNPLEAGSHFTGRFGTARARALIVAIEPQHRIAFTLSVRQRPLSPSLEMRFAINFEPDGDSTTVSYALRAIAAPPAGLRRAARAATDIAFEAPKLMELSLGRMDAVLRRDGSAPPATIAGI